jgi:uncharacterized protein
MDHEFEKVLLSTITPIYQRARSGDFDHVKRVAGLCRFLLSREKGDAAVVLPTAYLHDIGWAMVDFTDFNRATPEKKSASSSVAQHMEKGAVLAGQILSDLGYDPEKTREIQAIIQIHDRPEAVFAMGDLSATLVVEADRLDRYGKSGLARFKTMFGTDKLSGPYWEEARQLRLRGLDNWFRTRTARSLSQKLAREMGLFDAPEEG